MKIFAYCVLIVTAIIIFFSFIEAGAFDLLFSIISIDTIIISLVIILCTNRIVKAIKSVYKD